MPSPGGRTSTRPATLPPQPSGQDASARPCRRRTRGPAAPGPAGPARPGRRGAAPSGSTRSSTAAATASATTPARHCSRRRRAGLTRSSLPGPRWSGPPVAAWGRPAPPDRASEPLVLTASTSVPPPVNEPVRQYAPGSAERASLEAAVAAMGAEQVDLPMHVDGVWRPGGGDPIDVVQPHRHAAVLGTTREATAADVQAAVDAALAAAPSWRALSYDDRAARAAAGRRAARRLVARHPQRRHDARPEQDGVPGRDRQRLRADRLPALQRRLRPAGARRAAGEQPRRVEPDGPPAARGLRPGHHARSTSPPSRATCRSRPR